MIQTAIANPLDKFGLGIKKIIESLMMQRMTENDEIVAICRGNGKRQRISILGIPLPSPPPEGAEWIAAFRYWKRGGQ